MGFESFGIANPPGGTICPALGIGIRLLQGRELKPEVVSENKVVYIKPTPFVTNENLDEVYEEYKTWADALLCKRLVFSRGAGCSLCRGLTEVSILPVKELVLLRAGSFTG